MQRHLSSHFDKNMQVSLYEQTPYVDEIRWIILMSCNEL